MVGTNLLACSCTSKLKVNKTKTRKLNKELKYNCNPTVAITTRTAVGIKKKRYVHPTAKHDQRQQIKVTSSREDDRDRWIRWQAYAR